MAKWDENSDYRAAVCWIAPAHLTTTTTSQAFAHGVRRKLWLDKPDLYTHTRTLRQSRTFTLCPHNSFSVRLCLPSWLGKNDPTHRPPKKYLNKSIKQLIFKPPTHLGRPSCPALVFSVSPTLTNFISSVLWSLLSSSSLFALFVESIASTFVAATS